MAACIGGRVGGVKQNWLQQWQDGGRQGTRGERIRGRIQVVVGRIVDPELGEETGAQRGSCALPRATRRSSIPGQPIPTTFDVRSFRWKAVWPATRCASHYEARAQSYRC